MSANAIFWIFSLFWICVIIWKWFFFAIYTVSMREKRSDSKKWQCQKQRKDSTNFVQCFLFNWIFSNSTLIKGFTIAILEHICCNDFTDSCQTDLFHWNLLRDSNVSVVVSKRESIKQMNKKIIQKEIV